MDNEAFRPEDERSQPTPLAGVSLLRNIFVTNELRGRLDSKQTSRALALLAALPIQLDHGANETALLALARQHQLTAYDAAYLELAQRENVALATLDEALIRAARAAGVPVIGDEEAA
jgi:predicted nucleic acid-binding protein